jgi:hypothetical protein
VLKKGDNPLMKVVNRFKDKITGKVYILKMVSDDNTLWLEGENGLGRRLTDEKNVKATCEKLDDIYS